MLIFLRKGWVFSALSCESSTFSFFLLDCICLSCSWEASQNYLLIFYECHGTLNIYIFNTNQAILGLLFSALFCLRSDTEFFLSLLFCLIFISPKNDSANIPKCGLWFNLINIFLNYSMYQLLQIIWKADCIFW